MGTGGLGSTAGLNASSDLLQHLAFLVKYLNGGTGRNVGVLIFVSGKIKARHMRAQFERSRGDALS